MHINRQQIVNLEDAQRKQSKVKQCFLYILILPVLALCVVSIYKIDIVGSKNNID